MHLDVEDMQDQFNIQSDKPPITENPLQEIGCLIRKTREEKDLSIEDLAGSLRIGQEQLIALENGEEDLLPEKVFIKAMIRRVSERLHLDLSALLNEFQTDSLSLSNIPETKTVHYPNFQSFTQIPSWLLITGLIGVLTSGFAITLLSNDSEESLQRQARPSKVLAPRIKALDSSYHIVAPGQTLSTISKFHEIPLKTLIKINELNNPDKLKVGTKLSLKIQTRKVND